MRVAHAESVALITPPLTITTFERMLDRNHRLHNTIRPSQKQSKSTRSCGSDYPCSHNHVLRNLEDIFRSRLKWGGVGRATRILCGGFDASLVLSVDSHRTHFVRRSHAGERLSGRAQDGGGGS